MPKNAKLLEIPATITDRGQTTVPAAIRKMLDLGKRDRVVFRSLPDGTVVLAKQISDEKLDPVIGKFLAFLAKDMTSAPNRIKPVPRDLVNRGKELVEDMTVDLDEALPDEDP